MKHMCATLPSASGEHFPSSFRIADAASRTSLTAGRAGGWAAAHPSRKRPHGACRTPRLQSHSAQPVSVDLRSRGQSAPGAVRGLLLAESLDRGRLHPVHASDGADSGCRHERSCARRAEVLPVAAARPADSDAACLFPAIWRRSRHGSGSHRLGSFAVTHASATLYRVADRSSPKKPTPFAGSCGKPPRTREGRP